MQPISRRLNSFLQHKALSTSAFCRILQYRSCEKIARLFRLKHAKPSVDILEDIANHFSDLNIHWLITGNGEMLVTQRLPEAASSIENARLQVVRQAGSDTFIPFAGGQSPAAIAIPARPQLVHVIEQMRDEN